MRPLSIVDGQGFREMINTFYPGYTLPSRSHFTKLMEKKYEENFERFKASLKDVKSKIALTTDAWTSIATEAYLGVTCHFINEDWELTSYNLTTMSLEDRHTAENIANWVEKAAEKFEISMANVIVVVHDNAANVVAALRILEEKVWDLFSQGLQKSIQSTVFKTAAVKAFQDVAAQEMTSIWEWETKFKDDGENICLIAAALDPRFRKLKFLPGKFKSSPQGPSACS
ncbi:zinc finger BED domain-containing protein 1 [Tachysurus ichikawai]